MARNFSERLSEQLQSSPLVQETDDYMERTLSEDTTSQPAQTPHVVETTPEVKKSEPKKAPVDEKYPVPFVNFMQGAPKHCQALVDAATYANMQMLKNVGAVASNMSFGAMATQALQEWVDRKIKEYVKKNK